jgi:putative hydrolase
MTLAPYDALRRIAYLLERSRAGTYRVQAFRGAAATVLATDPAELESRAAADTLTDLPGIGSATEAVIRETLEGDVPEYLKSLEDKAAGPLVEGGLDVRAALRGDLHSHSDWSDGGSSIQEMVVTAMELGHDYLVLTDHSPRLKIANGLSTERLSKQLGVIDDINSAVGDFRLLKGIEVDILDDGSLDQSAEMFSRLDLRVASVHSKLAMSVEPMTRRMVAAVKNPHTNVLRH